jgi:hypothetical protein
VAGHGGCVRPAVICCGHPCQHPLMHGAASCPQVIAPDLHIYRCSHSQAMGSQLGGEVLFMDGTWNTNRYNYVLHAVLAPNELGCGVPIAFLITSSEAAEPLQRLLDRLRTKVLGGRKPPMMVDKGPAETAAMRALHWPYYLCLFHFLQIWRKWLRSKESCVSADVSKIIMARLVALAAAASAAEFVDMKQQLQNECTRLHVPQAWAKLEADWLKEPDK